MIVARGIDGATQSYVPVDNVHRDHILFTTTAPSTIANDITDKARHIMADIVVALDLVGLLAVEMFVLQDGDVLVNRGSTPPQFRAADARRVRDQSVRTVYPRRRRPAAGRPVTPFRCRDDRSDWRRS